MTAGVGLGVVGAVVGGGVGGVGCGTTVAIVEHMSPRKLFGKGTK